MSLNGGIIFPCLCVSLVLTYLCNRVSKQNYLRPDNTLYFRHRAKWKYNIQRFETVFFPVLARWWLRAGVTHPRPLAELVRSTSISTSTSTAAATFFFCLVVYSRAIGREKVATCFDVGVISGHVVRVRLSSYKQTLRFHNPALGLTAVNSSARVTVTIFSTK